MFSVNLKSVVRNSLNVISSFSTFYNFTFTLTKHWSSCKLSRIIWSYLVPFISRSLFWTLCTYYWISMSYLSNLNIFCSFVNDCEFIFMTLLNALILIVWSSIIFPKSLTVLIRTRRSCRSSTLPSFKMISSSLMNQSLLIRVKSSYDSLFISFSIFLKAYEKNFDFSSRVRHSWQKWLLDIFTISFTY
jgi:hypothetical protein